MRHTLVVLAHAGGWDEALIVGVGIPGALFVLWKLLDRARVSPAEPRKWDRTSSDRDASNAATPADADGGSDEAEGGGRDR